jgi:predicted transcriptional regulator
MAWRAMAAREGHEPRLPPKMHERGTEPFSVQRARVIIELLKDGPKTADDISAETGLNREQITDAFERVRKMARIRTQTRFGKQSIYSLEPQ